MTRYSYITSNSRVVRRNAQKGKCTRWLHLSSVRLQLSLKFSSAFWYVISHIGPGVGIMKQQRRKLNRCRERGSQVARQCEQDADVLVRERKKDEGRLRKSQRAVENCERESGKANERALFCQVARGGVKTLPRGQ